MCLNNFSKTFKKIGSRESSGTFGTEEFDLIEVEKFEFGNLKENNHIFSRANNPRIDKNLLGMDILGNRPVFFSYKGNEIILDVDDVPKIKQFENIYPDPKGLQPYIPIKCGDHVLNALWDTGAGITIVDTNFIERNQDLFELVGESEGTDSTGEKMTTPNYKIKSLVIGGFSFAPHEVAAVDLFHVSSKSQNPISIGLGFSTIKQADWYFDFSKNLWAITKFHANLI